MSEQSSRRSFLSTLMVSGAGIWVACCSRAALADDPKPVKYGGPKPPDDGNPPVAVKYGGPKKKVQPARKYGGPRPKKK
jgi:hypothetical protein